MQVVVELGVVSSILGLLNHDNTDIAVAVVDLLQVDRKLQFSERLRDFSDVTLAYGDDVYSEPV